MPGVFVARTASRKNAAFFRLLSTRCTHVPGTSASAQAMTSPGNPAPEPRSAQIRADGASAMSCSESAICRVQSFGSVDGATRLIRSCHSASRPAKRSRRAAVSRETGVSASARVRSSTSPAGRSVQPEVRGVYRPARLSPIMPRHGLACGVAGAYGPPARSTRLE